MHFKLCIRGCLILSDGWVYVDCYLDYETKAVYHLVIEAKDEGLEPLSAVVNVTIDVIDMYDYVPKFSKDIYEVTMNASAPAGTKIIDLKIDHTGITYSISGNTEYVPVDFFPYFKMQC